MFVLLLQLAIIYYCTIRSVICTTRVNIFANGKSLRAFSVQLKPIISLLPKYFNQWDTCVRTSDFTLRYGELIKSTPKLLEDTIIRQATIVSSHLELA